MKQGTQEWLNARTGLITGSRVGAILGVSPWAKRKDVLREMVRQHHKAETEFKGNEATQWGTDHEDTAISEYENQAGVIVRHHGLVIHPEYSFLGYSPDGSVYKKLVEVKCPFSQKIPDDLPAHYECQVQLGMEVMDLDACEFIYWTPDRMDVRTIERKDNWIAGIMPHLQEFYEEYLSELENPAHLEPLVTEIDTPDWQTAVTEYRRAKALLDDVKAREAEARAELIRLADNRSVKGAGLQLTRIERIGAVDYSKIPELKTINLDDYRKKGSVSYRIT